MTLSSNKQKDEYSKQIPTVQPRVSLIGIKVKSETKTHNQSFHFMVGTVYQTVTQPSTNTKARWTHYRSFKFFKLYLIAGPARRIAIVTGDTNHWTGLLDW